MGRVARRRVNRLRRIAITHGVVSAADGLEWAGDERQYGTAAADAEEEWQRACARELAELNGEDSESDVDSWAGDDRSATSEGSVDAAWDRACAEEMEAEFGPAFPDDDGDDDDDDDAWAKEWAKTLTTSEPSSAAQDDTSDEQASDDDDDDDDDDDEVVDEEQLARDMFGSDRLASDDEAPAEPAARPPQTCADFTIVTEADRRKRKRGPLPPQRGQIVRARADSKEDLRKLRRAAKFAREAESPPPVPQKKFAWSGGKITSNKEEATAKFLERQRRAT